MDNQPQESNQSNNKKYHERRPLPWWKKTLFTITILLILLIVLELLFRCFPSELNTENKPIGPGDLLQFSSNSRIGWELQPDRPHHGHNAAGFRGPQRDEIKPKETWRIAVLGDSITYGLGVDYNRTYSAELERLLRERGESVEVLNFGVPGFNSNQELAILNDRVWNYDPDMVIMTFSTDDVETTPIVIEIGGQPILFRNQYESNFWFDSTAHWWLVGHSELYRRIYRGIVMLSMDIPNDKYYYMYVSPETAFNNIRAVSNECRKRNVSFLLVLSPHLLPIDPNCDVSEYGPALDRIRALVAESEIDMVDLGPVYARYTNGELKVAPPHDCEHPNALGHAEAAHAIIGTVERLHQRRLGVDKED